MFNSILNKYNPKDLRSHGVLRFFVDDLTENDQIAFVDSIFEKGSWILPTEISKSSDSNRLKEETERKFLKIFNEWVNDRCLYSSRLSARSKNPRVTIDLNSEFREILLSIRNLNFSSEIMLVLKKFFESSNELYLKNFFKNSLSIAIEEYNEKEIEFFFLYFSDEYETKISDNYCVFINSFLQQLAYSYKIHDLTELFIKELKKLSQTLKDSAYISNYSVSISIFLIDLIIEKKLDLSNFKYDALIKQTIEHLDKSDYANLDFFRFLKKFNYPLNSYDFKAKLDLFFLGFSNNISILKTCNEGYKKDILHHYLKLSNSYFENLLFLLEQLSEKEAENQLVKFVTIIDELRDSFMSLLWFDEYLNFKKIKGKICSITSKGFEVKIDEETFNENILLRGEEIILNEKAKLHYGFGFLHDLSVGPNKSNELKDVLSQNILNNNLIENEITSFYALDLNFSQSFKGKVIQFVPESKAINKILSNYELKALFVSVEVYLIEKAYKYLKSESPFLPKTNHFKILCTPDYIHNYNIGFTENTFWEILKKIRPNLYNELYIKNKNDEKALALILKAYENKSLISGIVKSKTNGGMVVDLYGIEAFLPGSQIDTKQVIDYDQYIEQKMQFKVININLELKNVVISHRIIWEADLTSKRDKFISELERGQIIEGTVKNITFYGVFIDLGGVGVDGLIHITDLTWSRINHPNEVVKVDQKIKVLILDFHDDKTRIQLGLKQLYPDPWEGITKKIKIFDNVPGKVLMMVDYGAIIEISEGIEGFVHISDFSWTRNYKHPYEFLKLGDILNFVILNIDHLSRDILLGYKQQFANPWEELKFEKETVHCGMVDHLVKKGAIIVFNDEITAFVPSRHLKKKNGSKLKIGEFAEFIVIEFDKKRKNIMVSHTNTFKKKLKSTSTNNILVPLNDKYCAEDKNNYSTSKDTSLESSFKNYNKGDITTGIVIEVVDYGAYIKTTEGIESLIKVSEMSWNSQLYYAQDFLKVGDSVTVLITSINSDSNEVFSSIKQLTNDPWIEISSIYPLASKHTGIVKKFNNFGVVVSLKNEIDGIIDTSIYQDELTSNLFESLHVGNKIDVEILKLDIEDRKLFLKRCKS